MAGFKLKIAHVDTGDMASFEEGVKAARRAGFDVVGCASLAELTRDQLNADTEDKWLNFSAMASTFMKITETTLINGVLSRSHIEKNAALVREQSRILAKYDMLGNITVREPVWLPESFYEKHPDLRGPMCHHPGVAKHPRWAPCIDHPEVLGHYREAMRRIVEFAPRIGMVTLTTNDSGAGMCWCTGLYPGKNGPERCKHVSMGKRAAGWFQAFVDGGADAGAAVEVLFGPLHLSRDETSDILKCLPKRAHLTVDAGYFPNEPFFAEESKALIEASAKRRRGAVLTIDPTIGYPLSPVAERPIVYFAIDCIREAAGSGAYGIMLGPISPSVDGVERVATSAIVEGLKRPPKTNADVDRMVMKIAREQVGAKHAGALAGAWRDVDYALRMWPNNADTNHALYTFYSTLGDRWLIRPIVPDPHKLTADETEYYSKNRHGSRSPKHEYEFFVSENVMNYDIDELKWPVAIYETMMRYMDRAVAGLENAMSGIEDAETKRRMLRSYGPIAMLRALWRTQRNVLRCGAIIQYFTGPKKEWFWHGKRKDESYKSAPTYRRLFLEGVDDEIANAREIIGLIRESERPLVYMGAEESSFRYGKNLPAQLEQKIAIMEAHKGDIELLFPNCPPETFADPTYEWEADE